jgi:hypothetical protein
MEKTLTYYDARFCDTYHIHTLCGRFIYAVRYVGRIGVDGIVYDSLTEIPEAAREGIKQVMQETK